MRKACSTHSLASAAALVLALATVACLPPAAGAVTVTLGRKDLTTVDATLTCIPASCAWATFNNAHVADPGAVLASPADGVVTGWRANGSSSGGGAVKIHVVRKTDATSYVGIADSDAGTSLNGTSLNSTHLELAAGDLVAVSYETLNVPGRLAALNYANTATGTTETLSILFKGSTSSDSYVTTGREFLYNADVDLLAPQIASLDVKKGPNAGGTIVHISGNHLAVAKSVMFGSTAARITAADDTSITAVSPPNPKGGFVPVTVSTAGGTSPIAPAAEFAYDDNHKPTLGRLKFARRSFDVANIGGPLLVSAVGSKVSFTLSEDATVAFSVARVRAHGRLRNLPKKRRFSFVGKKGRNHLTFTGRPGRKALGRGRYVLLARPVDLLGHKGATKRVRFNVIG